MKERKGVPIQFIVGTIGIITLLCASFMSERKLISSFSLFIILLVIEIIIERIYIRVGDLTVAFETVILFGTYIILGFVPTLWIVLIARLVDEACFGRRPFSKVYFNIGMFIMMITIPHVIFYIAGYQLNEITGNANKLLFVIFALLTFLTNWFFISVLIYFTQRKQLKSLKETFYWDLYSNIIIIPLSILFIETWGRYSYIGILVFSSLIVIFSLIFRLVRNLVFMNNELKVVQNVAASISSRLNIEETTRSILEGINELVDSDYCAIIKYNKTRQKFITLDFIVNKSIEIDNEYIEDILTDNLDIVLTFSESFIIDNLGKNKLLADKELPLNLRSIIFEPILLENQMYGCIIIGSEAINKFTKMQLNIIDILSNQAVIAMENARLYNEAQNRAIIDRLTGLYNQRYFFEALDFITSKCSDCKRTDCISCNKTSLIIFDVDLFKGVNDQFGHQTGDAILSDVAKIIKNNVRANDIVSRYGGEEFTVILPNTNQDKAYQIAERVRIAIENTKFYSKNGDELKITVSGGISEYPVNADSGSTLLAYADRAMYIGSKQKGRNKISVYVN